MDRQQKGNRRSWRRLNPFNRIVRSGKEEGGEESTSPSSSLQSSVRSLFGRRRSSKRAEHARGGACATSEPPECFAKSDEEKAQNVQLDPTRTSSWTSAAMIIKSIENDEGFDVARDIGGSDDCSSLALSDLSVEDYSDAELNESAGIVDEDARSPIAQTLLESSNCCLGSSKQSLGGSSSCSCHVGSQSRGESSSTSLASSIKSAIEGGWPALATDEEAGAKEEGESDEEDPVEARRIKFAIDRGWPGTSFIGRTADGEQEDIEEARLLKMAMDVGWPGTAAATCTKKQEPNMGNAAENLNSCLRVEVGGSQNLRHRHVPRSSAQLGPDSSKWILRAGGGRIKCDELEQAMKFWKTKSSTSTGAAPAARFVLDTDILSRNQLLKFRGPCARSA